MPIEIMAMYNFSARRIHITKDRIPYIKTVVLWCSENFGSRKWGEICRVNYTIMLEVIKGWSCFYITQVPYTSLKIETIHISAVSIPSKQCKFRYQLNKFSIWIKLKLTKWSFPQVKRMSGWIGLQWIPTTFVPFLWIKIASPFLWLERMSTLRMTQDVIQTQLNSFTNEKA